MIQIAIFAELCNGVQNPHCISLYINALHCRRTTFKCKNIELFDNQFIVLSASENKYRHMEITNLLEYSDRAQLRAWLEENHSGEKECWIVVSRSKTPPPGILLYIDVVEEALCFGWIDSTLKKLPDGRLAQRLSPRRKHSHWTRLNMDRCMDLENRGLMTYAGRRAYENAYEKVLNRLT